MANQVKFDYIDETELQSDIKKPLPRMGHAAVNLKRNIVIFGGGYKNDHIPKSMAKCYSMRVIWSYNLDIDRWIKFVLQESRDIPYPSLSACTVSIGSNIYMHGGQLFTRHRVFANGVWKLSRTSAGDISWTQIQTTDIIAPRMGHAGWEYMNKLWIFGGIRHNIFDYLHDDETLQFQRKSIRNSNQLCCFCLTEHKWMTVKSKGSKPFPRFFLGTTKIMEKIWLYGGHSFFGIFDDLYELQMSTLTWTLVHTTGPHNLLRSPTLCVISETQLFVYGGKRNDASWLFDLPSFS